MTDPTSKQKILVVDDAPENIDALTGILQKHYQVKVAVNGAKALDIAQSKEPPDLILLDIQMPEMDGYEVCRRLKSQSSTKDIPVIFVTALDTLKDEAKALSLGGMDFITKPFNPFITEARVKTHMQIQSLIKKNKQMIDELQEKNQLLDDLARKDPLTGLSNRRDLMEKFEVEASRSKRNGTSFCLIMSDIDHFKQINDVYGHPSGDHALVQISKILESQLRKQDVASRWGGEEFLMMLPETKLESCVEVAERLRQKVSLEVMKFDNQTFQLTMSFGITAHIESEGLDSSMKRADKNLSQAKKGGRNRVVFI